MRLRSILAAAISTSVVVAALVISPSSANSVDDLVSANYESMQWGLKAVHAQAAWTAGYNGNGVKVAVIDTGVDPTHPDLSGQILDGATISYDSEKQDNNGVTLTETNANDFTDEYGHGTHVSGIIAAKRNSIGVTGLAYGAKIMPIKLANLDQMDLPAFSRSLVEALEFASNNGADVANLSLGGPALEESQWVALTSDDIAYKAYTTAICQAVTDAKNAGVVVVVAAGNYYQEGNPALVPATCTDAVSVASEAPNSTSTSYFSTTDAGVDITAPGENIISTVPTTYADGSAFRDFPYMEMSGTSMASPMVAAAAALYIDSKDSVSKPDPVETILNLKQSATDMTAIVGWDPYTGAGLVDAAALVAAGSVQTSVTVQPYLRLNGGRPAMNFSDSLTVLWDAPQESTIPDSYELLIKEKNSGTVHTFTFGGADVRGVIPWLQIDGYSYIQLVAHYSGHDESSFPQLYSVPQAQQSTLPTPTGMHYTLGTDGHLNVSWDAVPGAGVGYLELVVTGTSVNWIQQDFYKNSNGEFTTDFDTYLTGPDVMNSDFTISLQAWSGEMNSGLPATADHYAAAPMTVVDYQYLSNKVVRILAIANRAGCNPSNMNSCVAKQFAYNYQITTMGQSGRPRTNKGRVPLLGYSDDYAQIEFDNLVTNISGRDSLQSITLTAKSTLMNKAGIYPVYLYYQLPMGSTPASLRQQAGLPTLKR